MEIWKIILIPVMGFVIGYFTNYIAVKMLFHPRRKIFGIQGVLPKRKKQLAKNIGEVSIHILPKEIQNLEKIPLIGKTIISSIQKLIEKEVNEIDDLKLEKIILKVIKKELSFITLMGGILGFIIGLLQLAILFI